MATDRYGKYTCMSLTVCIRASHPHFGKAEVADCHCGLASYVSTFCSYTLQLYILPIISLCYYLQVQLTYLNELCKEYSGTACACANSGYQVLLCDFCQAPGNEATVCNLPPVNQLISPFSSPDGSSALIYK